MHPIFANQRTLLLYGALWSLLAASVTAAMAVAGMNPALAMSVAIPLSAMGAFACLSPWYVLRTVPLPETSLARFLAVVAGASAATVAIWMAAGELWCVLLDGTAWPSIVLRAWHAGLPWTVTAAFAVYFFSVTVHAMVLSMESRRDAEQSALELRLQARDAEMRALRARIHPHFLFNSLNSVSALTTRDPAAARAMCIRLADFLRGTLALGSDDLIRLGDELALAREYLAIESVRFGDRLRVEFIADDGTFDCTVPALVLQPLIENAVVHGIAHLLEGGTIVVCAEKAGTRLSLRVENPCDPTRPRGAGTGSGLENVRRRLHVRYGTDAAFSADEADGRYAARMIIPCADGPA